MTTRAGGVGRGAVPVLAVACLAACATPGASETAMPSPADMQRGWRVYVYGADGRVAGVTTLPQHPAGRTRPEEILGSIAGAFCAPLLDAEAERESATGACRNRLNCRLDCPSDDDAGSGRLIPPA